MMKSQAGQEDCSPMHVYACMLNDKELRLETHYHWMLGGREREKQKGQRRSGCYSTTAKENTKKEGILWISVVFHVTIRMPTTASETSLRALQQTNKLRHGGSYLEA